MERRTTPRIDLELGCMFSRRTGSAITGRTVDVSSGGMRVTTERPLAADEVLEFALPERPRFSGRARVLREQSYKVYALRFERLSEEARAELQSLNGGAL